MNTMEASREEPDDPGAVYLILSTVGSEEDAERLSRLWVGSHRAACVTRLPGARSIYSWEGAIQEENEVILLIKTSALDESELQALLQSLAADHPYGEPELLVFAADGGTAGYLDWVLSWRSARSDPGVGGV